MPTTIVCELVCDLSPCQVGNHLRQFNLSFSFAWHSEVVICYILHHCIIVLGIVACDMTNLYQNMWSKSKQMDRHKDGHGHWDTHLLNNLKPVADHIKDLSKIISIMSAVHQHKTEQCVLQVPLSWGMFLNPVSSDSKYESVLSTCKHHMLGWFSHQQRALVSVH